MVPDTRRIMNAQYPPRPASFHLSRFLAPIAGYLLIAGTALLTVQPCIAGPPRFVPAGRLKTPRDSQQATILADGRVLIVGGMDQHHRTLASAELYDPASRTWSFTGSMASPRRGHTATLLSNGMVLVTGGGTYPPFATAAELYDPATGTWMITGSPIAPHRVDATATLLPNGKVLVAGGSDGNDELTSADLYDPSTATWSATGDMTMPRSVHTATVLPDGDVLVLERRWLPPLRFRSRIVRVPRAALRPGAQVRGEEIARIW